MAAIIFISLTVCMPLVWGWRRYSLHPWLETIFSIKAVALVIVRSRKAPPPAASMWALDFGVSPL
jgi:hypothetical protein